MPVEPDKVLGKEDEEACRELLARVQIRIQDWNAHVKEKDRPEHFYDITPQDRALRILVMDRSAILSTLEYSLAPP